MSLPLFRVNDSFVLSLIREKIEKKFLHVKIFRMDRICIFCLSSTTWEHDTTFTCLKNKMCTSGEGFSKEHKVVNFVILLRNKHTKLQNQILYFFVLQCTPIYWLVQEKAFQMMNCQHSLNLFVKSNLAHSNLIFCIKDNSLSRMPSFNKEKVF